MENYDLKAPDGLDLIKGILGGGLDYYWSQLPDTERRLLVSRNPDNRSSLIRLAHDHRQKLSLGGMLGGLRQVGRILRQDEVPEREIYALLNNLQIEEETSLGWLRMAKDLDSRSQRQKKEGAAFTTALIIIALGLISRNFRTGSEPDPQSENSITITATAPEYKASDTATPVVSVTSEKTPVLTVEEQMTAGWKEIIAEYKTDGQDFLMAKIVQVSDVSNLPGFTSAVVDFLGKNDMLQNSDKIDYHPGEDNELLLAVNQKENNTTVILDGLHLTPEWIAHTFTYNQSTGNCQAVADLPLQDGSYQNTELTFTPTDPQICIGVSSTSSGRDIVFAFIPGPDGKTTVKAAIFKAP